MRDLTICPDCGRDFVRPVEWEEVDHVLWEVLLRCGNCDATETGTFDQATVDAFDWKLDMLVEVLARDRRRFDLRNMADETERFAAALGCDAILPEDF